MNNGVSKTDNNMGERGGREKKKEEKGGLIRLKRRLGGGVGYQRHVHGGRTKNKSSLDQHPSSCDRLTDNRVAEERKASEGGEGGD